MNKNPVKQAQKIIENVDKKFLFLTVSGAHLYGFESFNSDLDIRGCHFPDLEESLRYSNKKDTFEIMWQNSDFWDCEVDIVSHSLLKYLHLLTKQPNGYILEQIFSPLIITQTTIFEDLKDLGKLTFCKELKYHFGGFFRNQTRLLSSQKSKEVKLTLYQIRILCSSVYLARYHNIESNLVLANQKINLFDAQKVEELVKLKQQGEKNNFPDPSLKEYWTREINSKLELLDVEFDHSMLPNFDRKMVNQATFEFVKKHVSVVLN